jgi:hypothetical protein
VELRRRLSKGLLVQGNYVFAKAMTNFPVSSAAVFYQPPTLREINGDKTVSPFNVVHAFKANWIYELPFGKNHWLGSNAGAVLDRIIGGWSFHGAARIQSGAPFNIGNVQLVGMTRNDLQKQVKIRQGVVVDLNNNPVLNASGRQTPATYFLPHEIIANTIRAFNVSATTANGYSASGAPSGRYIAPASNASCIESFGGQCGSTNLILYGPRFDRYDLSIVKKTRITENTNFEFRAEFLNAFNHTNFMVGNPASDVSNISGFGAATFGQTSFAYRDLSTTNDPGGRLVQFVVRINF